MTAHAYAKKCIRNLRRGMRAIEAANSEAAWLADSRADANKQASRIKSRPGHYARSVARMYPEIARARSPAA